MTVTTHRPAGLGGRVNVYVDGEYVGLVAPSARRWARGWVVTTKDGQDLGDQPRRKDAVATLAAFVTSPWRTK